MKYLLLAFIVLLSGCAATAVPVARKFPDAPETLLKKCADLKRIEKENPLLSEVVKSVTENYTLYHECSLKNDAWIEWYNVQKKAFDIK
jgi:hypothetical protein